MSICPCEECGRARAEARVKELEVRLADAEKEASDLRANLHETEGRLNAEAERYLQRMREAEAKIERVRSNWPHIETPGPLLGLGGRRIKIDPGSPTCLRCKIEDLLGTAEGKP